MRRLMPLGLAVVLLACGCRARPETTPLPVGLAPLYAAPGLIFALGSSF